MKWGVKVHKYFHFILDFPFGLTQFDWLIPNATLFQYEITIQNTLYNVQDGNGRQRIWDKIWGYKWISD